MIKIYKYRLTYDGIGIYEAFKKHVEMNILKDFLSSSLSNWLPKPPEYKENYTSYFTELGYEKFNREVLPTFVKYLNREKINVEVISEVGNVVYSDEYQIVIKTK